MHYTIIQQLMHKILLTTLTREIGEIHTQLAKVRVRVRCNPQNEIRVRKSMRILDPRTSASAIRTSLPHIMRY